MTQTPNERGASFALTEDDQPGGDTLKIIKDIFDASFSDAEHILAVGRPGEACSPLSFPVAPGNPKNF